MKQIIITVETKKDADRFIEIIVAKHFYKIVTKIVDVNEAIKII